MKSVTDCSPRSPSASPSGSAGAARAGAPAARSAAGRLRARLQGRLQQGPGLHRRHRGRRLPGSECVVQALSHSIKGTLTIIAHDTVTDWSTGGAANRALTVMLEVKAPDGSTADAGRDLPGPGRAHRPAHRARQRGGDRHGRVRAADSRRRGERAAVRAARVDARAAAPDAVRLDGHPGARRGDGQDACSSPTTPATVWPRCCASR